MLPKYHCSKATFDRYTTIKNRHTKKQYQKTKKWQRRHWNSERRHIYSDFMIIINRKDKYFWITNINHTGGSIPIPISELQHFIGHWNDETTLHQIINNNFSNKYFVHLKPATNFQSQSR